MMKPLEDAKAGDLILNQHAAGGNRLGAARGIVCTEESWASGCIVSNMGVNFGLQTSLYQLRSLTALNALVRISKVCLCTSTITFKIYKDTTPYIQRNKEIVLTVYERITVPSATPPPSPRSFTRR